MHYGLIQVCKQLLEGKEDGGRIRYGAGGVQHIEIETESRFRASYKQSKAIRRTN